MDDKEKLVQMADLICCPEQMILWQYNNFIKELTEEEAYKASCILLKCWDEHYTPMIQKLRSMGVLKKVNYEAI